MQTFDVAIAGGGMVGLAVACGLQGQRACALRCWKKRLSHNLMRRRQRRFASRAINAASERLLQKLDVWSTILALRASAYHGMEVWGSGQLWLDQL